MISWCGSISRNGGTIEKANGSTERAGLAYMFVSKRLAGTVIGSRGSDFVEHPSACQVSGLSDVPPVAHYAFEGKARRFNARRRRAADA
jgi:hypothetical protein